MTIQECYQKMGADYEDVLKRLYSESMIRKFARMFLDDDSYPKLEDALKKENVEEAFRAAHTLKGVCQNLGFTNLYQPAYELTEVLRITSRSTRSARCGNAGCPRGIRRRNR